jgi:hypothetical protein
MFATFHVGAAALTLALVGAIGGAPLRAQAPDAARGKIWTAV